MGNIIFGVIFIILGVVSAIGAVLPLFTGKPTTVFIDKKAYLEYITNIVGYNRAIAVYGMIFAVVVTIGGILTVVIDIECRLVVAILAAFAAIMRIIKRHVIYRKYLNLPYGG